MSFPPRIQSLAPVALPTAPQPSRAEGPRPPPANLRVDIPGKTQGETGYFQYVLHEGRIWSRWAPKLEPRPFKIPYDTVLGSKKVEEAIANLPGPYHFKLLPESHEIEVTLKPPDGNGYLLRGGQLVPVPLAEAQKWTLQDGVGGPALGKGETLTEFQVSSEIIQARTNKGRVFIYDPTKFDKKPWELKRAPVQWQLQKGLYPDGGDIFLPKDSRDWAFGVSVIVKPGLRIPLRCMNPATDIVSFHTDHSGQKVAVGFTATLGVISPDGRELRYRDTGLPGDFGRGLLMPQEGRFRAEKMAQAGSTWLVYGRNAAGKPAFYTREYDYELFGACPGKVYMDEDAPPPPSSEVKRRTDFLQVIPTETWAELAPPSEGTVTDRMAMVTTGLGNDAREVRIEGTDAHGTIGVWRRSLAPGKEWKFRPTGEKMLQGKPVPLGKVDPTQITSGPVRKAFSGDDVKGLPGVKSVRVEDFHPFQTFAEPSRVVLSLDSGEEVRARLRTAEGWDLLRTPESEDLEGFNQGVGVQKVLIGTLELEGIPKSLQRSTRPEDRKLLARLMRLHEAIGGLRVTADQDSLVLKGGGYGLDSHQRMPNVRIQLHRDAIGESGYERQAAPVIARLRPGLSESELDSLIGELKRTRKSLRNELLERRTSFVPHAAKTGLWAGLLQAVNWLAHQPGVRRQKQFVGATELVSPLMETHLVADLRASLVTPQGYRRATQALDDTVLRAESQLNALRWNRAAAAA